jgi:hypothetical protein
MTTRRHFLRSGLGMLGAAGACLALPGDGDEAVPDGANVKGLIDDRTDKAIDRGLAYLGSNQHPEGSFGTGRYLYHTAISALGGLAFLASGSHPNRGRYGRHLMNVLNYLLEHSEGDHTQEQSGFIHNRMNGLQGPMYGHGFATLFLAEVHGTVHDPILRKRVKERLKAAVALIVRAQEHNTEGAWRYMPTSPDADISVTICQIMALRAARNAGIYVDKGVVDKCVKYVKACQDPGGQFRYTKQGGNPFHTYFARTAGAVVALNTAGIYKGREIELGLESIKRTRPRRGLHGDMQIYFYGHYYAVQAMYTAGGKYWDDWYPSIRDELVGSQNPDGSWTDPICPHYATAMACLILQVPNNYLPIMQK